MVRLDRHQILTSASATMRGPVNEWYADPDYMFAGITETEQSAASRILQI